MHSAMMAIRNSLDTTYKELVVMVVDTVMLPQNMLWITAGAANIATALETVTDTRTTNNITDLYVALTLLYHTVTKGLRALIGRCRVLSKYHSDSMKTRDASMKYTTQAI